MKLKDLFYELLAIPLLVPLLHNSVIATVYTWNIPWETYQNQFAWYEYTYRIDKDLNFTTIDSNWNEYPFLFYTFQWEACSNWIRESMLFWNNWRLFSFAWYRNTEIYWQWYITKVCKSNIQDFKTYCLASYDNLTNFSTDITELYNTNITFDQFYFNNYNQEYQSPSCYAANISPCFISSQSDIVYCVFNTPTYSFYWNYIERANLISTFWPLPSDYQNAINNWIFETSPIQWGWWPWWWWWSSWWDLVELESAYNVSEVLNAYWEMWYTNNLCYWNFALDDLAVSWSTQQFFEQDLEDWVYFTWASIFDLYRVYSWWYNFNTFMNSWLARFYPSYNNDISLWFIWYSKALWYNQYLIYIHRPTIQDFSYQNLYNFCYLSVAINNWSVSLDDNFNSSMINNWSLPSSVEEELESPWSILIPWTWSIFNWSWFTPWSWWAWWGGRSRGEWDEPSDAYWLFARLYDYVSWLSDAVDLWLTHKWILPSVIQFWFLVALLYYILKR